MAINWAMSRAPEERLKRAGCVREGRVQLDTREGRLAGGGPGVSLDVPLRPAQSGDQRRRDAGAGRAGGRGGHPLRLHALPNRQFCFCPRCKSLFEQQTEAKQVNYPEDVLGTGWHDKGPWVLAWASFRRGLISSLVEEIATEARRINPQVQVSLASWGSTWGALRDVAQDWFRWVENGWLDFICPMDYTPDNECLRRAVQQQVAFTGEGGRLHGDRRHRSALSGGAGRASAGGRGAGAAGSAPSPTIWRASRNGWKQCEGGYREEGGAQQATAGPRPLGG